MSQSTLSWLKQKKERKTWESSTRDQDHWTKVLQALLSRLTYHCFYASFVFSQHVQIFTFLFISWEDTACCPMTAFCLGIYSPWFFWDLYVLCLSSLLAFKNILYTFCFEQQQPTNNNVFLTPWAPQSILFFLSMSWSCALWTITIKLLSSSSWDTWFLRYWPSVDSFAWQSHKTILSTSRPKRQLYWGKIDTQ